MKNDADLLQQSQSWHNRADQIVEESGLFRDLAKFGEVVVTGSYQYNLMMTGDIDVHLVCEPSKQLAREMVIFFIDQGWWRTVKFVDNDHFSGASWANWPNSYYVGLSKWIDDYKWDVDIWLMNEEMNASRLHAWVDELLTPETKLTILRLKEARSSGEISPGGFDIYDAVLRNGVTDVPSFQAWRKRTRG